MIACGTFSNRLPGCFSAAAAWCWPVVPGGGCGSDRRRHGAGATHAWPRAHAAHRRLVTAVAARRFSAACQGSGPSGHVKGAAQAVMSRELPKRACQGSGAGGPVKGAAQAGMSRERRKRACQGSGASGHVTGAALETGRADGVTALSLQTPRSGPCAKAAFGRLTAGHGNA